MLLFTFNWKNFFISIFHCFLSNARKSCAPFMEILFPHDKILHGKFLPHNSLPQNSPPTINMPLKTSVHFLITITICKHWSKFVTCSFSHGDWGGVSSPQNIIIRFFLLCWIKWLSQNFDLMTLRKMSVGGSIGALHFF